jgi:hypothetical protein
MRKGGTWGEFICRRRWRTKAPRPALRLRRRRHDGDEAARAQAAAAARAQARVSRGRWWRIERGTGSGRGIDAHYCYCLFVAEGAAGNSSDVSVTLARPARQSPAHSASCWCMPVSKQLQTCSTARCTAALDGGLGRCWRCWNPLDGAARPNPSTMASPSAPSVRLQKAIRHRSEFQLHGPLMGGDSCLDAHSQIILDGITFSHFPGRLFSPRVGMAGYSYLAWLPLQ